MVAAENFWGNIAAQIGGTHVKVTSIISDPSADPHQYESDARDADAVAHARVVIENGLGYDNFMSDLLGGTNGNRNVINAAKVLGITGNNTNPHLWYDTPRVHQVAAAIAAQLAAVDPANKAAYAQNLATFDTSLQPILAAINTIKTRYAHTPVAYTERVPGYLLAAANLNVASPPGFAQAIEDGTEPSAADTTAMDTLMTDHQAKVLLYNAQATSPLTQHVRDLARQAGIPIVGVTETLPPSEHTFQDWQLHQVQALLNALAA